MEEARTNTDESVEKISLMFLKEFLEFSAPLKKKNWFFNLFDKQERTRQKILRYIENWLKKDEINANVLSAIGVLILKKMKARFVCEKLLAFKRYEAVVFCVDCALFMERDFGCKVFSDEDRLALIDFILETGKPEQVLVTLTELLSFASIFTKEIQNKMFNIFILYFVKFPKDEYLMSAWRNWTEIDPEIHKRLKRIVDSRLSCGAPRRVVIVKQFGRGFPKTPLETGKKTEGLN